MIRKCIFAGLMIALYLGSSSARAQDPAVIKFAIWTPDTEMTFQNVMRPFAEAANRDSNGTLDIQLFPNGALGRNPAQQLKMLEDGVADIVWVIPAYTPGIFTDNSVFELPNVIQNSTEGSIAAWRMLQRGMLAGYDDYYMIGLFVTAPYTFHMRTEVTSMEDLEGLKVRAVGGTMIASVRALGAAPEPMPFNQIVEALSRGVIDGTTGHPIAVHDFGPAKVAHYHYMNRLGTVPLGLFMRQESFDNLPEQAKAAIEKNRGEQLSRMFGAMSDNRNAELVQQWQKDDKRTVTIPSDEEVQQWDARLRPVIDSWAKEHPDGQKLLNALQEELKSIRAEN